MTVRKPQQEKKKTFSLLPKNPQKSPGAQFATEALYDVVADGIIAAEVKTGEIVSVNPGACRMFGYSGKEFPKKYISDLHPAQSRAKIVSYFKKISQKSSSSISNIPCVKKNGAVFFVDITSHSAVLGGRRCLVGLFHNVTDRKKGEEVLLESEEMFKTLTEQSPNMIFINQRGRVVYANPKCKEIMGYTHKEFYSPRFNFLKLMHPDDIPIVRSNFLKHQKGKEVAPYEYKMITKGGKLIRGILTSKLIHYLGAPAILGIVTDITVRKQAEEAVKAAEEELSVIYQNAPVLMMLIDEERRVRKVNGFATGFTGRSAASMIGSRAGEALRCLHALDAPEGCGFGKHCKVCMIRRTVQDTLKTGRSHHQVEMNFTTSVGGKEKFSTLLISTAKLKVRERPMVLVSMLDITERKQTEEEIKKSFSLGRATLESTADGILVVDHVTRKVTNFNERFARLWHIPAKVLRARDDNKLLKYVLSQLKDPRKFLSKVTSLYRHPQKDSYDILEFKDGRIFERYSHPQEKDGCPVGRVWSFRDVTEHKRAERALKESEEKFRDLFENSQDALMTIDPPSWKFTSANNSMVKIFRARSKAVLFRYSPWGLSPRRQPDGRVSTRKAKEMIQTAIQKGAHFFEWTHRRFDGTTFPAEVLLTKIKKEKRIFLQATVRDITERKNSETRLKENKAQLDLTLQSARMGVWSFDLIKNKRYFDNQVCHLLGIKPATFSGKAYEFFRVVHPEDRVLLKAALARTITKNVLYDPVYRVIWPDKSVHFIAARGKLFCDRLGHPLRINGVIWDITERRQAEETLRLSEERLKLQFQRMPIGCILWSPDFRVMSWNPAAEKIFGYKAKEALGRHPYELIVPKNVRLRTDLIWKRLLQGDTTANLINENVTKCGDKILCKWINTPLQDSHGKILGVLAMAEDITQQRQAEEALRLAHFSLDHANYPVFWVGSKGPFLYVNDAACHMLGYSRREMLKMNVSDIDPEFPRSRWPAHWKELREKKHMTFESFHKTKTGQLIPVEMNINYLQFEGKEYNFAFAHDITERKQAEDSLREHRHQLLQVIDAVPHMIFAKDRHGRFLLVNRAIANAYQMDPKELVGFRHQDVHKNRQEGELFLKGDQEVLASGKPMLISNEPFTDVSGCKHILQVIKIPFKMIGRKDQCILGVAVDVTEQKKVEEFRNDIVRTVSHELRTPLSIQKEGISLLMDEMVGPVSVKQKEILGTVMRSIDRLSRMITNLLDISSIETGKITLFEKMTNLVELVQDVAFEFKKRAVEKNIDLSVKSPGREVWVFVDPDKIMQVLSNLVDNAIKFTPKKGAVEISLNVLKNEVECEVRDTGIGVAPGNIEKMFEKFRQFSRTVGPGEKGFGLGLSISKGIIDLHGGRIWIKSELGKGTRVIFSLPFHQKKRN